MKFTNFLLTGALAIAGSIVGPIAAIFSTRALIQSAVSPLSIGQFIGTGFYGIVLSGSIVVSAVSFYVLAKTVFYGCIFTVFYFVVYRSPRGRREVSDCN